MAFFGDVGMLGGGIIGALGGGPMGAMQGAMAGRSLGGMLDPQKQLEEQVQKQAVGPVDAISRRKAQLDQTPLRQIRESIDSLKYVNNDAMKMELAKPLLQAEYMAKQKGQV